MSLLQRVAKVFGICLIVGSPALIQAQSTNYYATQGSEYAIAGSPLGDQMNASISIGSTGGYLVWQDNITDGSGYGISAVQLAGDLSGQLFSSFRVNQQGTNDQENPQVTLLKKGGAAFVWQGGLQGFQHIYARFLSPANLWVTSDLMVNTATNYYQATPVIATLTNGNVVVAWSSFGQDNADRLQGIYAQILMTNGTRVGTEFQINQFTPFNQRSPAITALPNGKFIVTWVSEKQRSSQPVDNGGFASTGYNSVDIYARLFNSDGTGASDEFLVNTGTNFCANPAVAAASDSTFIIAWSQKDTATVQNSWDVWGRQFSSVGVGNGAAQVINSQRYGDQFAPKISSMGTDYMVVWTSMGQDGSREGVYGQMLKGDGSHAGAEFRVNTTVLNQQLYPAVAADGHGRFLAVWSSYSPPPIVGGLSSLDLYAQRYATSQQPLAAPNAPFITAVDSYTLDVSWPSVAGYAVNYYEIFENGGTTPITTTNNMLVFNYNSFSSTNTFQLAYVLMDGRVSPLSHVATGATWGKVSHPLLGLPDNWLTMYWGTNSTKWPSAATMLAPGVSVLQVFYWGANPTNSATWLKASISQTAEGAFINWNSVPGSIYQIQRSTDLNNWTNFGLPYFAPDSAGSVYLGRTPTGFYQIERDIY